MSNLFDRILMAYRPLYLRGLLMDGQYRLPAKQEKKPEKGNRVVQLTPAFDPERKRVLVAPAAASANFSMSSADDSLDDLRRA
ncbi:hypothetical protein [Dyella acidisoli]|uniref:Uncharacterized protein n=1 Tax=Dyella acidisoli TaxID=1867834 RepID=A0ABQ5XI45_9GAMM|nr:hypothetical protein [Dyella acidisoli]GLQ91379.1 hypothetical protein GCM10007901_03290 [Dyella acidisoli]